MSKMLAIGFALVHGKVDVAAVGDSFVARYSTMPIRDHAPEAVEALENIAAHLQSDVDAIRQRIESVRAAQREVIARARHSKET